MLVQALARERQAELLREAEIARMNSLKRHRGQGRSWFRNLAVLVMKKF
jgi:hypothetical protein